MDPRLTSLLDLQGALSTQRQMELEYNEIPARKNEIQSIISQLEEAVTLAEESMKNHELEQRARELELKEGQESRVKKEAQILAVKNTKEHEAITHEIDSLDKKNTRLEDRLVELMDLIEKNKKSLEEKRAALADKKVSFESEQNRLNKAETQLLAELEKAKHATEKLSPQIDITLYRRFTKIFDSKNGVALATANGGHCGGCNIRLTPRTMQLAKRGQDIVVCEGCSRFLYWDESLDDDDLGGL